MKNNVNACKLCGRKNLLTFEHIPPKCAQNNKLVYLQGIDEIEESSPSFGRKKRSPKGLGKYSLCSTCNNNTGNWYANDFCDFTQQGAKILESSLTKIIVSGTYKIKPLNVIKQILTMFVAADDSGFIGSLKGVREYLLNKENTIFPEGVQLYIYSNAFSVKRLIGYCVSADYDNSSQINQWSEINHAPFGYFFTFKSPPPNELMVKINSFNDVIYNSKYNIILTTPHFVVHNISIGSYKNLVL